MPAEASQPRTVQDVVELVSLVSLNDVLIYEERGRRITPTAATTGAEADYQPLIRNLMSITMADQVDDLAGSGLGFRFRIVFDDRRGNEFVADVQARYGLPEPIEISDEVKTSFAQEVAFLAVYPYLRASIQMTASRMGAPAPVLAIVRRGEFRLGDELTEDQARANFADVEPEV